MALPAPITGETVEATDVTGIKDHLEGAVGSTAPYHFRQSSGNLLIDLTTNDGTTKLSLRDSDGVEVFSVDSNGTIVQSGALTSSTQILPLTATPAQTAEGEVKWDTDDDQLTVGDGTSRRVFQPFNKGTDIASATTVTLANDQYYHVTGTTTVTGLSTKPAGYMVTLEFDGALQLTYNATSFILRGGLNVQTVAGDVFTFRSEGSGNWREMARSSSGDVARGASVADQSVSSANTGTTFVDMTSVTRPIVANGVYSFQARIPYTAGASGDLKIQIVGPANCALNILISGPALTTGTWTATAGNATDISGGVSLGSFEGGGTSWVFLEGILRNGATAGNVKLQFAQNTSNATNTTILAGAFEELIRTA